MQIKDLEQEAQSKLWLVEKLGRNTDAEGRNTQRDFKKENSGNSEKCEEEAFELEAKRRNRGKTKSVTGAKTIKQGKQRVNGRR